MPVMASNEHSVEEYRGGEKNNWSMMIFVSMKFRKWYKGRSRWVSNRRAGLFKLVLMFFRYVKVMLG